MIAKYFINDTITDTPITTGGSADPYPASVIMTTGIRIFGGVSYDCTQEGLYRFFNESNGTCLNKIAVDAFDGSGDIYKIMSAISCNHLHGTADNHTGYQSISNAGRSRKWRSQCGYISGFCNWLLPQLGFTCRVVNVETLETKNGWDDGHLVIEVWNGWDWLMFDITNGCYFKDTDHLSTQGFIDQIENGGTFPDKIKLDGDNKFNSDTVSGIDLQIYGEIFHGTESQKEDWYRRIFQTVL